MLQHWGVLLDLIILRSIQIQLTEFAIWRLYDRMEWDDWPESSRKIFQGLRGNSGEEMILKKNVFVEKILPVQDEAINKSRDG